MWDSLARRKHVSSFPVTFYINLCLGAVCAPAYLFLIPSIDPEPGRSFRSKVLGTDLLGAILVAGAFVSGVIATSFRGVVYPRNSGQIVACYVISRVLFILFRFQQVFCIFTNPVDHLFAVEFCKERLMVLYASRQPLLVQSFSFRSISYR
jgi:hypothetical protein